MIRRYLFIIPLCIASSALAQGMSSAHFSTLGGTTNGASASASVSTNFSGHVTIGESGTGLVQSDNYRSYAGLMSNQIVINDVVASFLDEYPSASEVQNSPLVEPAVTIENAGTTISWVKYRVSQNGSDEVNFSTWTTAGVDAGVNAGVNKTRYTVVGQQLFTQNDNNYIQWRMRTSGNVDYFSGKYRVMVRANDTPRLVILSPDTKGGMAAAKPTIHALVYDEFGGVDPAQIEVRLDRADGGAIMSVNSSQRNDIYTVKTSTFGVLMYTYDGSSLSTNQSYRVTVTARDVAGTAASASTLFTVKGGAIADMIPYPSPFDPKVQPVKIRYVLANRSEVTINIYDMSGRLLRNIVDHQDREAGVSEDQWDGRNYANAELANGIYFCEIIAEDNEGEHRRYSSLALFGK